MTYDRVFVIEIYGQKNLILTSLCTFLYYAQYGDFFQFSLKRSQIIFHYKPSPLKKERKMLTSIIFIKSEKENMNSD